MKNMNMKKVILSIIAMITFSCAAHAQKIDKDDRFGNGSHVVTTTMKRIGYIDDFVLWIGLSAIEQDGAITYNVETEYTARNPMEVRDKSYLILDTFNGNYVELETSVKPGIQSTWRSISVEETVGTSTFSTEKLKKAYPVSGSQLESLISQGVSKVKIQLYMANGNEHEKVYKKDDIGKTLGKCREAINKALNK